MSRNLQLPTREIRSEIEIDAPPASVWHVLTDTGRVSRVESIYPPTRRRAPHRCQLDVRIAPPGARGMRFKPTVLAAETERELRWLGRFLAPGIFDGEHSFTIEPLAGGRTRFVQTERFSGILVAAFTRTLEKTQHGFEQMNAVLKSKAEVLA
jgi:hypothetical protein